MRIFFVTRAGLSQCRDSRVYVCTLNRERRWHKTISFHVALLPQAANNAAVKQIISIFEIKRQDLGFSPKNVQIFLPPAFPF